MKNEKPRERLLSFGPGILSNTELLTLIISSTRSAAMSQQTAVALIKSARSLGHLIKKPIKDLLSFPGMGPKEVASLIACAEFGSRLLLEKIQKGPVLKSLGDVLRFLEYKFAGEREENFVGILLDAKGQLIKTLHFSRGTPLYVHLSIPSIVRQFNLEGAASVILAHNHLSGDVNPSKEDKILTRRLQEACFAVGLYVRDHVIISDNQYFSFLEQGLLAQTKPQESENYFLFKKES